MKCSITGCNEKANTRVHLNDTAGSRDFCPEHAMIVVEKLRHPAFGGKPRWRVDPIEQEPAPIIDIFTKKRIGSWFERYAAKTRDEALEQCRKLHTLATHPDTPTAEATSAAAFRDRLMLQHDIKIEELTTPTTPPPSTRSRPRPRPSTNPQDYGSWSTKKPQPSHNPRVKNHFYDSENNHNDFHNNGGGYEGYDKPHRHSHISPNEALIGGAAGLAAISVWDSNRQHKRIQKKEEKARKKKQKVNPETDVEGIEKESNIAEYLTPAAIAMHPLISELINRHNRKKEEQEEQEPEESGFGFQPPKKSSLLPITEPEEERRYPKLFNTLSRKFQQIQQRGNPSHIQDFIDLLNDIKFCDEQHEDAKSQASFNPELYGQNDVDTYRELLHNAVHYPTAGSPAMPRDPDLCDLCEEDEKKQHKEGFKII